MGDIAERLRRELGPGRVIDSGELLADYGRDESPLTEACVPEAAVCVQTASEAATVLAVCADARVPVTPRGAGSGLCGGAIPTGGGVVLSTERMQGIIEISRDDLVAVVEPGVITGQLQTAVEAAGLFYPPDPASLEYCSLGGNAATNAGGPRAFRYGVTREYVLGLEVALMGGERLRVGRRTAKGVTGYDLTAGFVGSEGTFGVITELTLRLLPQPAAVATLLAVFRDTQSAGNAISDLLRGGLSPRVLELADRASLSMVKDQLRFRFAPEAGAFVLIELDGEAETIEGRIERLAERVDTLGAIDVLFATTGPDRAALWAARRGISHALRDAHRIKLNEDICVPRGRITQMLARVDAAAAAHDVPIAVFGHAGDGNLHVNMLSQGAPEDPAVRAQLAACAKQLFADTIELGGTLSGEHGIGLTKRDYMPMEQTDAVLEWQRRWKAMWDPLGLLNPGKILPARRRACSE